MKGCCTGCQGTGYNGDTSTGGRCWDCRGTGCGHPEPLCADAPPPDFDGEPFVPQRHTLDRYLAERYGNWAQPLQCENRRVHALKQSSDRCLEVAKYALVKVVQDAAANSCVVCDRCLGTAVDSMTFHPHTSVVVERLR